MSTEVEKQAEEQKQTEMVRTILSSFAPKNPDPKPEEKPAEQPEVKPAAEQKQPDPEPAKVEEPPKEEKKPKTKTPRVIKAEELLDEDAITKAATAAATAAVKATQKAEDPKPEPEPELPRSVQRKLDIFKELESDPKFKGITKQVVDFKKAGGTEDQYKTQWLKENPGKKFDPNDDDHTDWYAENDPTAKHDDIDDAIEEAQARLTEKKIEERATKTVEERLSKKDQEERRNRIAPMADQAASESVMEALEGLDPKLVEVVQKGGEKALAEEDPIAHNILSQVAPQFAPLISETIRIAEGISQPDTRNPVHATLQRVAEDIENAVLALDPTDRVKVSTINGRQVQQRFATMEDYQNMPQEKRVRYWTVGKDELLHKLRADQKAVAKHHYDTVMGAAKKRFGQPSAPAAATQQTKSSAATTSATTTTHVSPSVGSSAPAPAPKAEDSSKGKSASDLFFSRFRPV